MFIMQSNWGIVLWVTILSLGSISGLQVRLEQLHPIRGWGAGDTDLTFVSGESGNITINDWHHIVGTTAKLWEALYGVLKADGVADLTS